ncbi:MAG: hypothetical protein ACN6PW_02625 [Pseudomonas kermanshahensis]|uniref:hypothetical protein n=1 Tax=Pseudomonas kermanshahensis TaxID=2745482 RepID=UPI003D0DBAEE
MYSDQKSSSNESVLHALVSSYSELIEGLKAASNGHSYFAHFLTPDWDSMNAQMKREHFSEIHKVYVLGIVERCHIFSLTSLARTNSWLNSTVLQQSEKNLLGFSAALRGLLEATADTHDAATVVVDQLYNYFPFIYLALEGSPYALPCPSLETLENKLIHYSYARRPVRGSEPLPWHTNKSNAEYIQAIEKSGASGVKELYSLLCELTHPAARSVNCFLNEGDTEIVLDFGQDERIIGEILEKYEGTISTLVTTTVNSALVSLVILDKMGYGSAAPYPHYFSNLPGPTKIIRRIDEFLLKTQAEPFVFSEDMWHLQLVKP